jgi:hypothetical protein
MPVDFTATAVLELLVIGLVAGGMGGMLGVGGGIVMIPAMTFVLGDVFGRDSFHAYNLASISTAMILAIPASIRHTRAKAVVFPLLPGIVPLALVGVVGGVLAGSTLLGEGTRELKRIFGAFLEVVVLVSLFQEWRTRQGEPHLTSACPVPSRQRGRIGLLVGLPSGFIAGLLGIGGGVWAVPAQTLLLGVCLRNAIATSMVMIIAVGAASSLGMTLKLAQVASEPPLHHVAWWLTLWLAPGAMVGGWCGASLAHRVPVRWLRYAFQTLLAASGLRLIFP